MQTTTFRIGEALRRVKERSISIPQFQRPFTWRESQVKLLVDSLARNYPIGSILLLAKSQQLTLGSRSIEAVIREGCPPDGILDAPVDDSTEHFYVLDGQQRLTSMARVLLNAHPTKSYYFDLRALLEEFSQDEATWVVIRARGKNDPDRKDRGRLLRSDLVLDPKKIEIYVSEYLEDSDDIPELVDNRQRQREAAAQIKAVFETIRNYQIPVVVLERDAQVESVCRVFETINSTGTRLTTFDLAVARFFPKPDLRKLWNDTTEKYPCLVEFDVDGERLLQAVSLYQAAKEGRYAEPSRSDLLALPPTVVETAWDYAANALQCTYNWARAQGARAETLPNHGVLVAISAFNAYAEDTSTGTAGVPDPVLRRWYFCKVLQQGGRQAANYKIGQDFAALLRCLKSGVLPEFQPVVFSVSALLSLSRSIDVRYRALQCLMATTIRHDLVTGNSIGQESELHDHHIFPRRLSKSDGFSLEKLDSIVNRLPLLSQSNRNISDREPKDYFGELLTTAQRTGTMGDFKRRLADSMIPGDPVTPSWLEQFALDRFDIFCGNRAELLLSRIKEVVGDSLVIQELTPDMVAEND